MGMRIKSAEQGAAEGAPFIARHIIQASGSSFDDLQSPARIKPPIAACSVLRKSETIRVKQ